MAAAGERADEYSVLGFFLLLLHTKSCLQFVSVPELVYLLRFLLRFRVQVLPDTQEAAAVPRERGGDHGNAGRRLDLHDLLP